MLQLFAIILSLITGYLCEKLPVKNSTVNKFLNLAVLLILVIMGYEFGSTANNIFEQLIALSKLISICVVTLFIFNYLGVSLFIKLTKINNYNFAATERERVDIKEYLIESSTYLFFLILGTTLGCLLKIRLPHIDYIVNLVLLLILFITGYQLRNKKIPLKNILLNKLGIKIAVVILFSSLTAGIVVAFLLNINLRIGLILCSGFGWYTLSGILTAQLINHQLGTASFFIDFIRELVAIILIPAVGRKIPYQIIGYSGATALDFTLPIVKINLGENILPTAISCGMFLTILVPVLIPILSKLTI